MPRSWDIQNFRKGLAGEMQEGEDTHASLDHQQEAGQGPSGYLIWQWTGEFEELNPALTFYWKENGSAKSHSINSQNCLGC